MAPRISLVMPVYNTPPKYLTQCLQSILDQTFDDWELRVIDDASTDVGCQRVLRRFARKDPRVHVERRTHNGGIADASNDGVQSAQGEFVALVDHDDLLDPRALARVVAECDRHPDVDFLYSDETYLTSDGVGHIAQKPDWAPERLRSQNYPCHLSVIRASLLREVGGFRTGFEGSQDYDLILRVTERARRIVHIRESLYTWRIHESSFSKNSVTQPVAFDSGRRAIQDHCDRLGIAATVEQTETLGVYRVRRQVVGSPLVSVIIPTRGSGCYIDGHWVNLVVNCVRTLLARSTYPHVEIVVVADAETPESVLADLRTLGGDRLRIVGYDQPFNFADKCNRGVLASSGEVVILLNDDIEVIDADWCETMLAIAQQDNVGAVGCLLYMNGLRVQHAGHLYFKGAPTHEGLGLPKDGEHVNPNVIVQREVSGVTGAALMVRRKVYLEVGGMSNDFPNNYNDVDLCLKLRSVGYDNIYTPYTRMYHFESVTRDWAVAPAEITSVQRRWWRELQVDPFSRTQPQHAERGERPLSR